MFKFEILNNSHNLADVAHLLPSPLMPCLSNSCNDYLHLVRNRKGGNVAFTGFISDTLSASFRYICLALTTFYWDNDGIGNLYIDSIFVSHNFRRQGCASELLRLMTEWAVSNGISRLIIDLPKRDIISGSEFTNHLFSQSNGWHSRGAKCLNTISNPSLADSLCRRLYKLRSRIKENKYHFIFGDEISSNIDFYECSCQSPLWTIPLGYSSISNYLNTAPTRQLSYSIFLVQDNAVIGWILTEPVNDALLRYSVMWIDSRRGGSIELFYALSLVIRKAHLINYNSQQEESQFGNPFAQGCFGYLSDNIPMDRLTERMFSSLVNVSSKTNTLVKLLTLDVMA